MRLRFSVTILVATMAAVACVLWTAPGVAQGDFFKGKTMTVYAGTTPGALYDRPIQ
jgi:hypothetical protein